LVCALFCISLPGSSAAPEDKAKLIARGKYRVVDAGRCQDCHTPHDQQGRFIEDKWLQGSELMFKPLVPIPGWTTISPGIAGLPNWTDQQAIKFLTTGVAPDGSMANPPMPEYRFNLADAKAIVAYLRSLKSGAQPLGHSKSAMGK
ncbi:MAG: c-type cytochrome, partial [Terriglobales bacterium]